MGWTKNKRPLKKAMTQKNDPGAETPVRRVGAFCQQKNVHRRE